jgi:hypothetical protein
LVLRDADQTPTIDSNELITSLDTAVQSRSTVRYHRLNVDTSVPVIICHSLNDTESNAVVNFIQYNIQNNRLWRQRWLLLLLL